PVSTETVGKPVDILQVQARKPLQSRALRPLLPKPSVPRARNVNARYICDEAAHFLSQCKYRQRLLQKTVHSRGKAVGRQRRTDAGSRCDDRERWQRPVALQGAQ